jgi:hypothetical protein
VLLVTIKGSAKARERAGYRQQFGPAAKRFSAGRRFRVGHAWPAISPEAGCQQQVGPAAKRLSLEFATPRQIATEVRQIQLQTPTETQLRKQRNRPWIAHRNGVRPRPIEGTIGTGGGTRMIGA